MNEKLYQFLLKLPKETLLQKMIEALDIMQGYNGQSVTQAVASACNLEMKENSEGRTVFRIKKGDLKRVKEEGSLVTTF